MKRVAPVLILVAVVSCGKGTVAVRTAPTPTPSKSGNFTLFVSNQSFDRPDVQIDVRIDGDVVVSRTFAVEGQHTWIPFDVTLEAGAHSLRATNGDTTHDATFTSGKNKWAVLQYWCCDASDDQPKFTFEAMSSPPMFD